MTARDFETLVLPLTPRLRARARQFSAVDPDDLVQETLLRAWRAWGKYEVRNPWGWLWLIMRNAVLDARRDSDTRAGLLEKHAPDVARIHPTPPRPDWWVSSGPDDMMLKRVRQLEGTQRNVVELQLLGLDDAATAHHLQIDRKTVRTAMFRAKRRLRSQL